METQLFEYKDASTEIIGPVVGRNTGKSSAILAPNAP